MKRPSTYDRILKEICLENNFKISYFSDGWTKLIEFKNRKMFIHGYKFPNNSASISELCTDKSSMAEVLKANKIPTVQHFYLVSNEDNSKNIEYAKQLLATYKKLVIKPNNGTGGASVFRVCDSEKLVSILTMVLNNSTMVCISPYLDITAEYRTIIFKDTPVFTFEKIRPYVIADGEKSFFHILQENSLPIPIDLDDYLPHKGDTVLLNWKHNLQGGASPKLIEPNPKILQIATQLHPLIGINFASVDIVLVDGEYYVLEINSGVMTEYFANSSAENYQLTKSAYQMAIFDYFGIS